MGADSELKACAPDGGQICGVQIALAQMDEIAMLLDSQLPIIVDNELSALSPAEIATDLNLAADLSKSPRLDSQLNGLDTER